jgi:hypothetical protein
MTGLRKRSVARMIGVALGAPLLVGMAAPSAQAATHIGNGRPGNVTYYQTEGSTGDVVSIPSSIAWRSPATSGQQVVYVQYSVGRLLDGWGYRTAWIPRTIPAGAQGVWLPRQTWDVTNLNWQPYNQYRVSMEVRWADPTGLALGSRAIGYNQDGDYRCLTYAYFCTVGNGALIFPYL